MTEREQSELMAEAHQGRKWLNALEVFNQFLTDRRNEIITALEESRVDNMNEKLAELRVIRKFFDFGRMHIERGTLAERKLADG